MPSFRLLGKDILVYGVMGAISKSIALLLLPVLTRQFSPGEYGTIDIIATLASLLTVFIGLSLDSAVSRFWYENKKKKTGKEFISSLLFFISALGVVILAGIWFFSPSVSALLLEDSGQSSYIMYGSTAAFFGALSGIPMMVLRMDRNIVKYNILALIKSVLYAAIALFLIFRAGMGLESVFIAMVLANLLAFIIGAFFIGNVIGFNISYRAIKPSLSFSLPMVPAVLVTWINNQADRLILLAFLGLGVVGVFGASARVALAIGLLTTIFRQAWSPFAMSVIEDEEGRDEFYSRAFNYYAGVMFCVAMVIIAFSRELMAILAPEEYLYGYVVIPWVIGAKVLHASGSFTNLGMVISKKTFGNSIAAWSGAIINILLAVILIPVIGIWGAAIGSFIAELIFTGMLWFFTKKESDVSFDVKRMIIILILYVAISGSIIAIYEFVDHYSVSLIARIVLMAVSCFFVIKYTLRNHEITKLKNLL